jgi:hypothetical protein
MMDLTKIIVSIVATQRAERWPVKRRSNRLHKKLTKLRGPQFYDKPGAIQTPSGLVVHPEIYAELKRQAKKEGHE